MNVQKKYGLTIAACSLGYLLQAVVVNVSPILFITLKEQFLLSYSQLGLLVLANFVTQFLCDILFGRIIDRKGFRPFALGSAVIAALGLFLFSLAPVLWPRNPYPLFFLATLLFAGSGGLLEVLLSPIINALPLAPEKKTPLMSFVHAAYSWGQVMVVLLTSLMLVFLGASRWQWILLFWCLPAIVVFFMFCRAPLEKGVSDEKRQSTRSILKNPTFILFMLLMLSGGAGELIISQWASSFLEKGLAVDKTTGDIIGLCAFAAAMGICRTLYGKFGEKIKIEKVMTAGLFLLFLCYLAAGLAPGNTLPLMAIALSGIGVSLVWPGTIAAAADRFPLAGSLMFAFLAAGGDMGASSGPWLAGKLMDISGNFPLVRSIAKITNLPISQISLRIGMLSGAIFPLLGLLALYLLGRKCEKK